MTQLLAAVSQMTLTFCVVVHLSWHLLDALTANRPYVDEAVWLR